MRQTQLIQQVFMSNKEVRIVAQKADDGVFAKRLCLGLIVYISHCLSLVRVPVIDIRFEPGLYIQSQQAQP